MIHARIVTTTSVCVTSEPIRLRHVVSLRSPLCISNPRPPRQIKHTHKHSDSCTKGQGIKEALGASSCHSRPQSPKRIRCAVPLMSQPLVCDAVAKALPSPLGRGATVDPPYEARSIDLHTLDRAGSARSTCTLSIRSSAFSAVAGFLGLRDPSLSKNNSALSKVWVTVFN